LLILLAVLLLPYLVTPFYRTVHPVSTLMAWRWLKGAPVSRPWINFSAISPYLPRSVVGSEDAKFCSHHGVDWDALRDVMDDAEDGETVLHEFGHAIQDAICPDFGQSPEAAAMGEGFGDYFAGSFFAAKRSKIVGRSTRDSMLLMRSVTPESE